jgi:hypothetical protein
VSVVRTRAATESTGRTGEDALSSLHAASDNESPMTLIVTTIKSARLNGCTALQQDNLSPLAGRGRIAQRSG